MLRSLLALLFSSLAFFVSAQENSVATGNIFLDSDQDGLTDAEEKLYGTNPHNPDTDGDGYSDGAEVKAGYDPLKRAPGDKLATTGTTIPTTESAPLATDGTSDNLTKQVAEKISGMVGQVDPNNPQASLDQIQKIVTDSLDSQNTPVTLPEIDRSTIHIKKQNYTKSEEQAKKKEDFSNYITKVFYIFASNSPTPITSASDITSTMTQTAEQLLSAISSQNPAPLENISKSGGAILDQLKDVEVPEDLVDLHIKAMQYALYAISLKDLLKSNTADPLLTVVNFSQISAFIQSLSSFANDAQTKLDEYDVSYEDIQNRMKGMGVEIPALNDLNSLLNSGNSSSTKN